jgi:uroporphyrinogen-III synthase
MENSAGFIKFRWIYLLLLPLLFCQCQEKNNWANKSILVTAPAIYNERLSAHINATGMKALSFPVIETTLIDENAEIDSILLHLEHYQWISLTSRNAIKAFIKRAGELNIPLPELQAQHYCAIGKDQELLRSFGLDSIVDNEEASPQGILRSLKK